MVAKGLIYTRILIFFSLQFITNLCAAQKDYCIFQNYSPRPTEEIAAAIRNDLASKDPLRQDRAVLFLSILINTGKKSQKGDIIKATLKGRLVMDKISARLL